VIVRSTDDLAAALSALPNGRGLVQPYLPGPLHSVAGIVWEGRLLRSVHAVSERIWPRGCGSMTSAVTVPPDPEIDRAIERLLGEIGWSGIFQLDLIVNDGERYLIDLNPRLYTSLAIARAAGANLAAAWVRLLLGDDPAEPGPYRPGIRYRYETRDLAALFAEMRAGSPLAMLRGLRPRRGTVHAVFDARDPLPVVAELRRISPSERRRRRAAREGR
jgi:predicted ATP-grasp superfamily ATP-dependent carboligase